MAHLSEGMLRRLYDEPNAVSDTDRDHYNGCGRCRGRFAGIAEDARAAQSLMAVPAVTVDPAAALRQVKRLEAAAPRRRWALPAPALPRLSFRSRWVPAAAGLLALFVASFALVGAGYADTVLNIFQPQSTKSIVIQKDAVNTSLLPDLSTYGDVKVGKNPELAQADSIAAAARTTGLPTVTVKVSTLPASVPKDAAYATVTQGSASFTFSYAKAKAAADARGKQVPPMPARIDGSTINVQGGPAYAVVYGYDQVAGQLRGAGAGAKPAADGTAPATDAPKAAAGRATGQGIPNVPPLLGIAVAKVPVVTTTNGVSAKDLENYLAEQPGISAGLKAQILAIGDPVNTLPIPVPAEYASSTSVKDVQGVTATAIGDNTGLGAGVIWVKNGVIYAVVGTITQEQAIAVARGLTIVK